MVVVDALLDAFLGAGLYSSYTLCTCVCGGRRVVGSVRG